MAGTDLLFGPMLIGVLLNMMLYGVMLGQMFVYYQRYAGDFAWIRYFMFYLFVVETAVVVVEVGIIYQPLVMENGTPASVVFSPKLLPGDSLLIAIASGPIQFFTAWRIKVITESYIIPALVCFLSVGSFTAAISVSALVMRNSQFSDFSKFTTEAIVWLVCSAACDIVIAIGLTYALYSRKTGSSVVDGQINRIVQLTIETGSATAVAALMDVLLFILFPNTAVNFIVDFPLSTLYTCSVLAMLNSRDPKKAKDAEHGPEGTSTIAQTRSLTTTANKQLQASTDTARTKLTLEVYTMSERVVQLSPPDSVSERSIAINTPHPYQKPHPNIQQQDGGGYLTPRMLVDSESEQSFQLPLQYLPTIPAPASALRSHSRARSPSHAHTRSRPTDSQSRSRKDKFEYVASNGSLDNMTPREPPPRRSSSLKPTPTPAQLKARKRAVTVVAALDSPELPRVKF
ncbi:hypothetical protein GGX14DRAFT_409644 [Mycena pura]|uniref:DUF6534 domain-containing protein n=1 Tax=Mycena pura TaxID=153505 RepID=A0AAD7E5C5_9AGAR|nr:hypothetical protein GGX14DRAFT_409644 [Mycena pura]